jgi:hypothetical protein
LRSSPQIRLVHGDSHYFKVDKPINRPDGGVLANFTRVETFGARNTHWVSATIDPTDPTCSFSSRASSQRMPAEVVHDGVTVARGGRHPFRVTRMGREPQLQSHHRSPESTAKRLAEALEAGRARRSRLRRGRPACPHAPSRHHELERRPVA